MACLDCHSPQWEGVCPSCQNAVGERAREKREARIRELEQKLETKEREGMRLLDEQRLRAECAEKALADAELQIRVWEEALDGVCTRCFWSGKAETAAGYQAWSRSLHGTKSGLFVCSRCLQPEDEHGGTAGKDDTCLSNSGPYCSQFEANAQIHAPTCRYAEKRNCPRCGSGEVKPGAHVCERCLEAVMLERGTGE